VLFKRKGGNSGLDESDALRVARGEDCLLKDMVLKRGALDETALFCKSKFSACDLKVELYVG